MATPNVAGAAAVILEARPDIQPGSLKTLLKQNADTSMNVRAIPGRRSGVGQRPRLGDAERLPRRWSPPRTRTPASPTASARRRTRASHAPSPHRLPSWNNSADFRPPSAPQVGVANTITAQVRNNGYARQPCWLTSASTFSRPATTSSSTSARSRSPSRPTTTVPVSQPWTPAAPNHQCIQVTIDFGPDTNYRQQRHPEEPAGRALGLRGPDREPFFKPAMFELRREVGPAAAGSARWPALLHAPSLHRLPAHEVRVPPTRRRARDRESGPLRHSAGPLRHAQGAGAWGLIGGTRPSETSSVPGALPRRGHGSWTSRASRVRRAASPSSTSRVNR